MQNSLIKVIVWILVIVELWLLLQIPSVGDALFSFVVGGELPGTERILSLRQMILLLIGLFILAGGIIFRNEINRAISSRGSQRVILPVEVRPRQPHVAARLLATGHANTGRLRQAVAQVRRSVIWFLVLAAHAAVRLGVALVAGSTQLWQWARPRIERCDRWIARKVKQHERSADALAFANELVATVKSWFMRVRPMR